MARKELLPSAAALLQSLRGLGYSSEGALADLIDNSISADARHIDVVLAWNDGTPRVEVLDDGAGMSATRLVEAMRFGGAGPNAHRKETDLGRFGLGLKTASLSQCRRLTVASKVAGSHSSLSWDVDHVEERGSWEVQEDCAIGTSELAHKFLAMAHGTLVVWERMDSLGGLYGLDKDAFFGRVSEIRAYLGMIFHRFLDGDARRIIIRVNGRTVTGWDPFQLTHPATMRLPPERLSTGSAYILVSPYVLPHRDRFKNDAEFAAAGGQGGWTERQGFYVYRAKRLIVCGGWLGLGGAKAWTRDESSRLARISVDLTLETDAEWRIDVRKAQARPPAALRRRLAALAQSCRERAREVFAWRGGGSRRQSIVPAESIWSSTGPSGGASYRINRQHSAVIGLKRAVGNHANLVDVLLSLVEKSVPVERIWFDVSEQRDDLQTKSDLDIHSLAAELASIVMIMHDGDTNAQRLDKLLRNLRVAPDEVRRLTLKLLEVPNE